MKWDCTNELISIQVMENVSCSMDKCHKLVRETIGFLDPHGLHSHVDKLEGEKNQKEIVKMSKIWDLLAKYFDFSPLADPS